MDVSFPGASRASVVLVNGDPSGPARRGAREPGVRVTRGGATESAHRVHVAVAGADGRLIGGCGDPGRVAFYRSAAKPLQALPLVEDGVLERFGFTERELALCCASHNAEPEHLALARSLLARAGLDEGALACGPHPSLRPERVRELWAEGVELGAVHNNCSGKHAGMLALAVVRGWPIEGYLEPGHPVQRRMLAEVARWTGLEEAELVTGTDGCGVVTFAVSLAGMAAPFARFTAAADAGDPAARIVAAMTRHPFAVAGTGRTCTAVMERLGGRVFVKTGDEGVYCGGVRGRGIGFALKVEDGARRASDVALLQVLADLGVAGADDASALAEGRVEVVNTLGVEVGRIESAFRVEMRR